jgi:single-stranded DNA-binding protein
LELSNLTPQGRLRTNRRPPQRRRWDDKETGQKSGKLEVVANQVNFMPKGKSAGSSTAGAGAAEEPMPEVPEDSAEIPF